jgi:hypothetical protein
MTKAKVSIASHGIQGLTVHLRDDEGFVVDEGRREFPNIGHQGVSRSSAAATSYAIELADKYGLEIKIQPGTLITSADRERIGERLEKCNRPKEFITKILSRFDRIIRSRHTCKMLY